MKIVMLGGADEVGASCALVDVGGYKVLVDCGIRMTRTGPERLPDLSSLEMIGAPDVVVLTHAHLDHTGALPLVNEAFPDVPILATAPTVELTKVLLADALKVMESRWERESEIPLYQEQQVLSTLERSVPVPFLTETPIFGGDMTVTFHPAGHILGAAMVSIQTDEGTLLFSGDISTVNQLTVPGLLPPRTKIDLVVCESTYGNRLHADRRAEERRLTRRIASVIAKNGKVLVPSFALGRAQEVILILQRAMERKEIPGFPIYVDGMVTKICSVYSSYPMDLSSILRKKQSKGDSVFFPEGGHVRAVQRADERMAIAHGDPCCIVASSGMLSGGASAVYAMLLSSDPKNMIAITGYQDEESPGKALLSLADGKEGTLNLPDGPVDVRCKIEKYALSAHADAVGIAGLISGMRPDHMFFVHGDGMARKTVSGKVAEGHKGRRYLPKNGEEYEMPLRSRRHAIGFGKALFAGGLGAGKPIDAAGLRVLSSRLIDMFPTPKPVTVQDIMRIWTGEMYPDNKKLLEAKEVLNQEEEPTGFEMDDRRPYLYKPIDMTPAGSKPCEMNYALKKVDAIFGPETGLYKRGALQDERQIVLSFHFPLIAAQKYAKEIEELAESTSWEVILNETPHHGALIHALKRIFPLDWQLAKQPSIHFDESEVHVKVVELIVDQDETEKIKEEYKAMTGFDLLLEALLEKETLDTGRDGNGRMEINAAFRAIDDFFSTRDARPRKKSRKQGNSGPYIELGFMSPAVGKKHEDDLRVVEKITGWCIVLSSKVDQQGVKDLIKTSLPNGWRLSREPSFFPKQNKIVVPLTRKPRHGAWNSFARRMEKRIGLTVELGS